MNAETKALSRKLVKTLRINPAEDFPRRMVTPAGLLDLDHPEVAATLPLLAGRRVLLCETDALWTAGTEGMPWTMQHEKPGHAIADAILRARALA